MHFLYILILSLTQNTIGIIIIAYDNSYWCNIDETIYKLHEIQAPEKKIYQKHISLLQIIHGENIEKASIMLAFS